ncbi:hypothetical protein, partial [Leptospira sp. id769339]|uniref:hypothetical protein n=1 Tax=Leptospira sp. id769339 TaxID=2864221 RepID=UPI00214B177B
VCLQAKLDCVLLKFFIVLRFTGHAGFILFSCIPVSTKSGEVHSLGRVGSSSISLDLLFSLQFQTHDRLACALHILANACEDEDYI